MPYFPTLMNTSALSPPGTSISVDVSFLIERIITGCDEMEKKFPSAGVELTVLLVVGDIEQSRSFYRDVLGAEVYREYGGTSCVLNFQGSWILLVTGSVISLSFNPRKAESLKKSLVF